MLLQGFDLNSDWCKCLLEDPPKPFLGHVTSHTFCTKLLTSHKLEGKSRTEVLLVWYVPRQDGQRSIHPSQWLNEEDRHSQVLVSGARLNS